MKQKIKDLIAKYEKEREEIKDLIFKQQIQGKNSDYLFSINNKLKHFISDLESLL